jgi:Mn2+/Fe2+ NRAMP family transporter
MAEAAKLLAPVRYGVAVVMFALILIGLEIAVPYKRYAPILKWLTISLFAYVVTCIIVTRSWMAVLKATFVPQVHFNFGFLMIIVGVLGTTISPYMFFWQAAQEKEEGNEKKEAKQHVARRFVLKNMRIDTVTGMLFSEITAWCILLTTGEVLHAHGVTDIKSAAQAASAIEPLVRTFPHAGKISEVLFALGILGTGALAVPIFAATSSYALSELMGWKEGLSFKFSQAPRFYLAIVAGTVIGICINVLGVDPIKALVYTAVLNGVVAVPMIFLLIRITSNRKVMGQNTSGAIGSTLSWIAFVGMGLAAAGAVYAFVTGRQ